jgi:hypothetical protein
MCVFYGDEGSVQRLGAVPAAAVFRRLPSKFPIQRFQVQSDGREGMSFEFSLRALQANEPEP